MQFIKYAVVGGLATGSHIIVFYCCALFVLPCMTPDDFLVRLLGIEVPVIAEATRAWHAILCNAGAFVFSNTLCYLLNRRFVFKPGRHHWAVEFLLFFGVSGLSMLLGTAIQTWLIVRLAMQTTLAFGANLIASLLINYAMRRFVIFKG